MANRLLQVLAFVNVPALGTATLPAALVQMGSPVLADVVAFDAGGFTLDAISETSVTVRNDGLVAASVNVFLWRVHTTERVLGPLPNLTPQPFVIYGGAAASGGGANIQAFRYTATGVEGTDFFITLPAARANDDYRVLATPAGVAEITAMDFPDVAVGDRTTTQFRCVTAADLQLGDQIDLVVVDAT